MAPMRKQHLMMKIMTKSLLDLPAPTNISLWWNWGSLLGMFLMIQTLTGIFLSMHYTHNTELAFMSLIHIKENVNWGWIMHNSHMNGASFFLLCMYMHMARAMYYGSYALKKTWNIGVTIFIMTMMTAFMGYILPWGQMSFWGATVITNIFSATPYLGNQLVEWLWGGFAISSPTLNRFFIIHFTLPFMITTMMMIHFMLLHESGSNNPLGINSNSDRIQFHQYFTMKDIMGFLMMITMFIFMTMLLPNQLNDPENFMEASPLMTPTHIQPEWYFLWLYAILRSVPNKLGGVIALLMAIFILYLPPMTTQNKLPMSFCPISQLLYFMLLTSWFILSWIGSCPVETPFILIGQIFTTIYILYFLLIPVTAHSWDLMT